MAFIHIKGKPISGYNMLIIIFATFGSITYGYCSNIISTTLEQPTFTKYFGLDTASNETAMVGAINGLFQGGGLFGTITSGFLADKVGRRKAMFFSSLICIVGGALQSGSVHIAMYLVARFVTGFGIGGLVMIVPLWQSEVAPSHARGLLVGTHGVSILFGYNLASWIGYGFFFVNTTGAQWRVPLALQCVPALVLACGVHFIPESPRWLIVKDRQEEAKSTLKMIHRGAEEGSQVFADAEFEQLHAQIQLERTLPSNWKSLFGIPHHRKRAMIEFLILFSPQLTELTGTTVINNYGPSLYETLGYSESMRLLLVSCWLVMGLCGNVINALLLDLVGRKRLMVIGLILCGIAVFGEGLMLALFEGTNNRGGNAAAVFFLWMHLASYATCIDGSTYVYGSEIWPTHLRAKGFAISVSGLFVGSLIMLEAAPTAFASIGWRFYMIMLAFTVVNVIIFSIYFPETKGLMLEEIPAKFGDEIALDGQESGYAVTRESENYTKGYDGHEKSCLSA